ncbi:MAG: NAD-dependent succinate-semialdehyde dehydrogenase [Microlunatus sp.]|nr:NAD-dependent succinate-semialdehyde dehydrogenase [Microlunatus sp.]MDN5769564.1 NAD-dependent succinate-semialdehyde dehydrogenase [Microlunatus sp.]
MSDYAVVNPATGELVKTYDTASDADIQSAIGRAHEAFHSWGRTTTVAERAALVRRAAELHRERATELVALIVEEMGKPVTEAEEEVEFSAAIYEYYADNAEQFLADEDITLLDGEGSAMIRREPLGVLLGIMPWNFPAYQVARFAAPNLCLGNTILLKHAPQCPSSSAAIAQIFADAGFPDGAYLNIYATNDQAADIIADPRVQGVSITGSERAGAAVAEIAGRNLKKVVLELGGSDPFIVLATDDMDATVEAATAARLGNTGQACNNGKRFIVVEDLYDDFVEKFNAKIIEGGSAPLSSAAAAKNLSEQVATATAGGAELTTAGQPDGAHYPFGVLTGVSRDNEAFHQELFGPVAMVFKAADEAEAVELANDTPFGLGSYVFTNDTEQARRVADQIEAGMVFVNCVDADGAELPFGGVKRSGNGRELGRFGIEEFVNRKMIRIAP